ncbi:MAG TPA: type II toxin-antitoxin system VapC family toxin [Bryobacteraceae bacterium]|nr:type II toxin-antitoxin system VapC family toxin [Bryobacteraceae bacterium]
MRAIDTNLLVRLIVRDDARQAASVDQFIEDTAWVPVLALADAVWVLRRDYKLTPPEVAAAIGMLLAHKHLVLQDSDAVAAALELFRARPALGFTDCLIVELARKAGNLPLGTFDRSLGKLDGAQRL